jgi:DNA (cytosine-5)-methyltransferase 1
VNALDLYCGAGGATRGLQQAGFRVVGVDLKHQPNYCGDNFVRANAVDYLRAADLDRFDFIWASPPCQRHTALKTAPNAKGAAHRDWIPPTRELLERSRKPWVIENVVGAPLIKPVALCGSMFNLRAPDGAQLRRQRLFETSGFPLTAPCACRHSSPTIGVYGAHLRNRRRPRGLSHLSGSNRPWAHGFIAMGVAVGSMTLAELSEGIPPTFARFIAEIFLRWSNAKIFDSDKLECTK